MAPLMRFARLIYHSTLSWIGGFWYGFPARKLKVIAVTGTKGKSTTVFMIERVFREQGRKIAMIGSLGTRIEDIIEPNTLKMTMPGRFHLQRFLRRALDAGCEYVVMEATSEGIAQGRLAGIRLDCAVFTNLHPEHIESHGGFENYKNAKLKLFCLTPNIHVINTDDPHARAFIALPARQKFAFLPERFDLKLVGDFNVANARAALTVAYAYRMDRDRARETLKAIDVVPGRMEFVQREPFAVVVDYAHTPESLESAYQALHGNLICVLGACGGGRDQWKRKKFGEIAQRYCSEIIVTNEDPYDEDPEKILDDIGVGQKILDRREAIRTAIRNARPGDTVIITGKGSETSMALAGGVRIPWSDRMEAEAALHERT